MVAAPFIGIFVAFLERGPHQSRASLSRSEAIEPSQGDRKHISSAVSISITAESNGKLRSYGFELARLPGMSAWSGWEWSAGGLALFFGVDLVVLTLFLPGPAFGIPSAGPISKFVTALAAVGLSASLMGLFAARFGRGGMLVATWRMILKYAPAVILVASVVVMLEVSLPGRLLHPLTYLISIQSSQLIAIAVAMSGVGLALGYFLPAPLLLTICRGTLTCSLVALLIAKSPALFDQDFSEIWLSLVQDSKIRVLIRLAMLLVIGGGIAIAVYGATKSFGSAWAPGFRRALAFFFAGLGSYAIIYALSPGYVLSGYAERLAPFAIFFLSGIPAIAICGTVVAGRRYGANFLSNTGNRESRFWGGVVVPFCLTFAVAMVFLLWTKVQVYYAQIFPPNHAAFASLFRCPRSWDRLSG